MLNGTPTWRVELTAPIRKHSALPSEKDKNSVIRAFGKDNKYDSKSFVLFLTFDGELEFVAWKLAPSKDGSITFTYRSVQKQCILS